jgi:phosphate:Na+ symporter
LIREKSITSEMVSSLANDSNKVAFISKKLIEAGQLIYIRTDTILEVKNEN